MNVRLFPLNVCLTLLAWLFAGCVTEPPPIVIHEEPNSSIWLMFDPEASRPGHSHPATFTAEQMERVLTGVSLVDRNRVIGEARELFAHDQDLTQAFSAAQIKTLAPLLAQAFKKASPVDMVTFYLLNYDASKGKLITSGGLFVRGGRLYVMLANCRTAPSTKIYETAHEVEARDMPLLPVARFLYIVGFKPKEAWIPNGEVRGKDGYERYLDESKLIVIDLNRLFAGGS
ncbi:MAG: hypothetical protein ACKOCD_11150 [Nitrospiraceae bacterium]